MIMIFSLLVFIVLQNVVMTLVKIMNREDSLNWPVLVGILLGLAFIVAYIAGYLTALAGT